MPLNLLLNPRFLLGIALLVALGLAYQKGRNDQQAVYVEKLRKSALAARETSANETVRHIASSQESGRIKQEFENRDDQASIDWAAMPVPAGELERLHIAVGSVSANP